MPDGLFLQNRLGGRLRKSLERVCEKYLSGDWSNHLPVSIYHGLTSICQINEAYDIGGVGGKSNLCSRK